jgi:SAM-dependent methyltransferase
MEEVVASALAGRGYGLLVDAGCGDSPYRPLFEPHVREYVGCDLPGNPSAQLAFEPSGRIPVADGAADVVLSSQVLEHIPDPGAYLAEARRILSPRGVLVLSTHGTWRYHPDPADYWRWTRQGLLKLVEDRGFAVQSLGGVMGPGASALQLLQDAVLPLVPRPLQAPAAFLVQPLLQLADHCTSATAREREAGTWVLVARRSP